MRFQIEEIYPGFDKSHVLRGYKTDADINFYGVANIVYRPQYDSWEICHWLARSNHGIRYQIKGIEYVIAQGFEKLHAKFLKKQISGMRRLFQGLDLWEMGRVEKVYNGQMLTFIVVNLWGNNND